MNFAVEAGPYCFPPWGCRIFSSTLRPVALLAAIYSYLDSDSFRPEQELSMEALEKMIRTEKYEKR